MADKLHLLLVWVPLSFLLGWGYSWLHCLRYKTKPLPGEHMRLALFFVAMAVWIIAFVGEVPVWMVRYQDFLFWAGIIGISLTYLVMAVRSEIRPKRKRKRKPKRLSGTDLRAPPDKVDT